MKKLLCGLMLVSLVLTACSSGKTEKERFISATVDVTCMVFESGDLLDPSLEQKTKDIFSDYGFDVEDEEGMTEIAAKYQNDADVQTAVEGALKECAGDLFEAFGDAFGDLEEAPADGTTDAADATDTEADAEAPAGDVTDSE